VDEISGGSQTQLCILFVIASIGQVASERNTKALCQQRLNLEIAEDNAALGRNPLALPSDVRNGSEAVKEIDPRS
jgi:hypothetical protein